MEYARCGIVFHPASMPIAGTSGPCTLAGTVTQQNCENLAVFVLSQLLQPGCPVFYGAIGGRADMRSLRPRFGIPEARLIEAAGAQMADHYGLSCRGGIGLTDAPSSDFQAGMQAMLSTISILQNGPNYLPSCGLLGSYVGASFAKIILDIELIRQVQYYLKPIRVDDEALAADVIGEVGPGGCFIQSLHTLDNYREEYLAEGIFSSSDYETWSSQEKRGLVHAAHDKANKIIDSYQKPIIDPGLEEEIDAYVKSKWVH